MILVITVTFFPPAMVQCSPVSSVKMTADQSPNLSRISQSLQLSPTFDIHVYLLNIDERITTGILEDYLSNYNYTDTFSEHGETVGYVANFTVDRLAISYYDDFINYVNTTGIGVNATHANCNFNLADFNQDQPFSNLTGLAINASNAIDWIENSWYKPEHEITGYVMYLMNLSALDTLYERHWFTHVPYDTGTNDTTQYFFSGKNGLETRPVPGWGNQERFYFLDVSSYHWFGTWLENIWGVGAGPEDYLSNRLQDIAPLGSDLDNSITRSNVVDYLVAWIDDITSNLFLGVAFPYNPLTTHQYSFQTLILSNLTDYGYNVSDYGWLMNNEKLYQPFEDLTPYLDYDFNTTLAELSDYPELESLFGYFIEEYDNYVDILDTNNNWNEALANLLYSNLSQYFDLDKPGIVFPTLGILTNDTTFRIGPTAIAGVSFIDEPGYEVPWMFVCVTPKRFMRENETGQLSIPDRSLNQLLIHEMGHTVGLPHPHEDIGYRWGGDFIDSAVSYYAYSENFSFVDRDRLGRYHSFSYQIQLLEDFEHWHNYKRLFTGEIRQELLTIENKALASWQAGNISLQAMNFTDAILNFRNASGYLQSIFDVVGDVTPPTIYTVNHETSSGSSTIHDDDTVIVRIAVTDESGIQGAILYYRVDNGSWSETTMTYIMYANIYHVYGAEIGPFSAGSTVEYYAIVSDNSSNSIFAKSSIYSFSVQSVTDTTGNGSLTPFEFGPAGLAALGLLLVIKKRKIMKEKN